MVSQVSRTSSSAWLRPQIITPLISRHISYTNYDILERCGLNVDQYQHFQAWMLIWAAIMHLVIAVFNGCDYTRFITDQTCTTFGLYVGVV